MPREYRSWLSGPPPYEPGPPAQGPNDYPGQRLGLPAAGSGSLTGTARRFGALMTDYLIAVGLSALAVPVGLWTSSEWFYSQESRNVITLIWLLLGVVSVRLFTFTPGQFAFGLRVASIDHREYVGVGRALVRGLLVLLIVPVLFADSDGRGLQDKVTGTAVVRR